MSIDWLGIRGVFREHAYQNRLQTRQRRRLADMYYAVFGAETARICMDQYETRTGLPAWTCRPLASDDVPPMPRVTRGEQIVYTALRLAHIDGLDTP